MWFPSPAPSFEGQGPSQQLFCPFARVHVLHVLFNEMNDEWLVLVINNRGREQQAIGKQGVCLLFHPEKPTATAPATVLPLCFFCHLRIFFLQ